MDDRPLVIELRISRVEAALYGWVAGFVDCPGDTLCQGHGACSYAECIAEAVGDFPDHSLVEIRVDGLSAGTWSTHALSSSPAAVADEVARRLAGLHA
jgi:hypothetical protein